MRLRYLIPRFIIVAILWVFFTFAFDPLVRYGVIASCESVVGARVDLKKFRTGFFPPKVDLKSVNIANHFRPGKDLLEFENANLNFHGNALLRKQFVIESGEISGIRIGDLRDDDGQLPESEGGSVLDGYSDRFKETGAAWIDDLAEQAKLELDPNKLETYQVGEQVRDKWEQRIKSLRGEVAVLEPQLKNVEALVRAAKHEKPVTQIQQYTLAANNSQTIFQTAQTLTAQFQGFPNEVRQDLARLNQARLNDQARIKAKADLLKPDPVKITELLFGPEMTDKLKNALSWFSTAKQYKEVLTDDGSDPTRYRGSFVSFPLFEKHPTFLMKKLNLSGFFTLDGEELPFRATVGGITSDPVVLGKPAELQLAVGSDLQLRAQFDRTGAQAIDRLVLTSRTQNPASSLLGDEKSLAVNVLAGLSQWDCNFQLVDEKLTGRINLAQTGVKMAAQGEKIKHPVMQRVLADVLSSISDLDCSLNVSGNAIEAGIVDQV